VVRERRTSAQRCVTWSPAPTSTPTLAPRQEGATTRSGVRSAARGCRRRCAWSARPTRWPTSDAFVDLHQKRWGAQGSIHRHAGRGAEPDVVQLRLFELLDADETSPCFHFLAWAAGGSLPASGSRMRHTGTYTTPGSSPRPRARPRRPHNAAPRRSRSAILAGRRRFDYLRGDEPYKYDVGRSGRAIQRLLVVRTNRRLRWRPASRRRLASSRKDRPPSPAGARCASVGAPRDGHDGGPRSTYTRSCPAWTRAARADRISLSHESAERRIARLGIPVHVIDEPDDAIVWGPWPPPCGHRPRGPPQPHVPAELVGTRAANRAGRGRPCSPYVVGTVHSSRLRSPEDRAVLRDLTPRMTTSSR